ncbi:MAG: S41 family peptidase [Vicinamibacterales bacterium]
MTFRPIALSIAALVAAGGATITARVDTTDTLLLSQPATDGAQVAFVYAGDLWAARLDGSSVRRLTTDDGLESNPAFSPDGTLIAFSAQYEGNTDVYTVPATGGVPKRQTWHPGSDIVQGFTPDGKAVTFTSARTVFTNRHTRLFTVPLDGGFETELPVPHAARATWSPDGRRIAYNPLGPAFLQWKLYRGGRVSRIWLYSTGNHATEKIAQPGGRANDADPMWLGDKVFFRSDRNGEFNIFSYDTRSRALAQVTRHEDFPVLSASAGGGKIVYEQAGRIHLLDPSSGTSRRLSFAAAADLRETRSRFVKGARYIRNADLSPSGARAVFEFRGEIITVPGEKGDVRNLTNTTGVHERSPAWSPDGKQIAYFSDRSGEYALHLAPQDGSGEPKTIALAGAGFYRRPAWSPDSQKIAFEDNSQSIFWLDVKTGTAKKVASVHTYSPIDDVSFSWSPDSKWIAYTLDTRPLSRSVFVYSLDQDKSFEVTDGLSAVSDPVFDRGGKYLFFFGSTDEGPVRDWFSQAREDMRATRAIYLLVLRKDLPSPLAKESDEEQGPEKKEADKKEAGGQGSEAGKPEAGGQGSEARSKEPTGPRPPVSGLQSDFKIDTDGMEYRILDLPVPPGDYDSLQVGTTGQVYFLKTADGKTSLQRFELTTRKTEPFLAEADAYVVSQDGKKLLYGKRPAWSIVATTKKVEPSEGRIAADAIDVKIDPRAEWTQIFDEAWRINRDYFYAPNMHGVDWKAAREKYAAFLPHVATRADLNRVMQWMSSELAVGHHNVGGGDALAEPKTVPGGLLGADYEIANGRYRLKKVYGGLNWNPQLRSPLTEPGVNARAGEYLLAVNGRDLRPPANVHAPFENAAGKIVSITVGPNPDGTGSRVVQVVPVESESALRNRDWVEGNLRKVDRATGGRVAYVYVPNTAALGHTYFKRYFYPQAHKDAVIVDERFNGGGSVADYYIDIMRRPLISYWAMRYGDDLKTPTASIQGPKAMIIDETAGSGGDLLPWMFHKFGMGPLIGQRTWGGLVGILGFPVLMDGGGITAPNLAIWTPEDGWVVENEGVAPDIEVEQTPADVIAGRDPQLEKAIAVVMDELKKNPAPKPKRPPYPVKGKTQRGTVTTDSSSPKPEVRRPK